MTVRDIATQKLTPSNACAISKLPVLLVENLRTSTGIQAAVESRGNETVKRQDALLTMLGVGMVDKKAGYIEP